MENYSFVDNPGYEINIQQAAIELKTRTFPGKVKALDKISHVEISQPTPQNFEKPFRLFVKNCEYVYARANDIILVESCDHLVKVYVACNAKVKKALRHNTLKEFLTQLPEEQFLRIGRFCALNTHRLSGGNFHEQTLEFDFNIQIKLTHPISRTSFSSIGK